MQWQVQGTARVLPGYPTLRTLGVTAALKMAAVEVLGMPSKKESLILTVKVCSTSARICVMSRLCRAGFFSDHRVENSAHNTM